MRRDFEDGSRVARADRLEIHLRQIDYEERYVLLRLEVHNPSDLPMTVERRGLLLAYNGVELPPSSLVGPPVPPSFTVEGRGSQELWLTYVTGDRMLRAGQLVFRTVRQDSRYLMPLALDVPPAPLVNLEVAPQ